MGATVTSPRAPVVGILHFDEGARRSWSERLLELDARLQIVEIACPDEAPPSGIADASAVVLAAGCPRGTTVDACRAIRSWVRPSTAILVVGPVGREEVRALFDAGAHVTLPLSDAETVARALSSLFRLKYAPRTSRPPAPTVPAPPVQKVADRLTPREREVLQLLLLGRANTDIATALGVSPRTARFHVENLLRKVGAESRLDLLRVFVA